jgi:rubrerythrin
VTAILKRQEVYRVAVEMERNGLAYYNVIAELATDPDTRSVYKYLASAEKRHLRLFKKLWTLSRQSPSPESYSGEYKSYLRVLLKDLVFSSSASARSRAARSSNAAALNTGIKAEKDSILFYTEMLDMVAPEDRAAVQRILNEEKRHLSRLLDHRSRPRCLK